MQPDDLARLRHILDAAYEARSFVKDQTEQDFLNNRMMALAVVQLITVIGEAASQMSIETQATLPQIPWPKLKGMRNRLVHRYFDIRWKFVWDTLIDDPPPLIIALEAALGALDNQEGTTQP